MKKVYLVIGSNNFWYAQHSSLRDAKQEAREIVEGDTNYSDEESGHTPDVPESVHIFRAEEVEEFTMEDEKVVSTL